jgi:hypothetical protein
MSAHQAGATTLTQQSENFGYSTVRLRRITKLQFGIVNPTELVCTTLCMSEYIHLYIDLYIYVYAGVSPARCSVVILPYSISIFELFVCLFVWID